MARSLIETIKEMQITEAVDLLAEVCEGLIKRIELQVGPPGQKGDKGDSGISNIPGPQGAQGERGKDGVTLEEFEKLIHNIIGKSADEYLKELVRIKRKISQIANDKRYQ